MLADVLAWWPLPVVLCLLWATWCWWREELDDTSELERIKAEMSKTLPPGAWWPTVRPDFESPDVVLMVERGPDGKLRRPKSP